MMTEDIVISSYKEQIKQSILKANAVKIAGFDIIITELNRRNIDTTRIVAFFDRIANSTTKEEIDNMTVDELNKIIDDINMQITRALISPVEVAELLIRKSKSIALEKSPNGKIDENDNYVKVGVNLASEIHKHGIALGLNICIKNFCIQKLYQAEYREKVREKEQELGIVSEDNSKTDHFIAPKNINTKKSKTMKEIFGKDLIDDLDDDEELIANFYDLSCEEKKKIVLDEIIKINGFVGDDDSSKKLVSYQEGNTDNEDQNLTKIYYNLMILEDIVVKLDK